MADTEMEDVHNESDAIKESPFSEQEKEILGLYDEVQKLEVEVALTRARVRLAGKCEHNLAVISIHTTKEPRRRQRQKHWQKSSNLG